MPRIDDPFTVAVVGGLALFGLLLLPVLLEQYRRFGRPSARRVLAVSAVCVYAVALVAYTFLPLPTSPHNCGAAGGAPVQLVPFHFVRDIARETAGDGVLATLTSRATLQVVLNVVLFVPFGLLLRRFGGRSFALTSALGLLVSLAIELTQGSALWGLYDCAYRVGDVDDLLTNTLGAVLGAWLAPRFLAWLPMPRQLVRRRLVPARVTPFRRWLGMVVDLVVFTAAETLLTAPVRVAELLPGGAAAVTSLPGLRALPALLAGVLVFLVPAQVGSGASLGQRLVWLRPSWPGPATRARRLLLAAVGLAWSVALAHGALVETTLPGEVLALALAAPGLLSPVAALLTRHARGISFVLAGAELVDSRSPDSATGPDDGGRAAPASGAPGGPSATTLLA